MASNLLGFGCFEGFPLGVCGLEKGCLGGPSHRGQVGIGSRQGHFAGVWINVVGGH